MGLDTTGGWQGDLEAVTVLDSLDEGQEREQREEVMARLADLDSLLNEAGEDPVLADRIPAALATLRYLPIQDVYDEIRAMGVQGDRIIDALECGSAEDERFANELEVMAAFDPVPRAAVA